MTNKKGVLQISVGLLIVIVLFGFFVLPNILDTYRQSGVNLNVKVINEYVRTGETFEIYFKISNNLAEEIEIDSINIDNSNILTRKELIKYFPKIIKSGGFVEKNIEASASFNLKRGLHKIPIYLNYHVENNLFEVLLELDLIIS